MQIKNQLISSRASTYAGTSKRSTITIHETANASRGAGAQAHANLQANNPRNASWHIQVDDTEAIRSYPDTVRCGHAGAGAKDSIAIEICVNSDSNYDQALRNAAEVVKQLMDDNNLTTRNIVGHTYWTGKNCPAQMLGAGRWDEFIAMCEGSASSGSSGSSGGSGGSGSGGSSKSSNFLKVTGSQVPVRNGAGNSNSQIGTVHTGQLIHRDSGRDTPNWYGVGSGWFVRKNTATTASADESEGLYVGQWPGRRIPSARSHTWESHWSWVELMARIGYTDSSLSLALQKWLRSFGNLNVGPADGDFGSRSIRALQRFLANRDQYSGAIDGDRGPMTIGAEIAYLNSQISNLGSKWPQHARAN